MLFFLLITFFLTTFVYSEDDFKTGNLQGNAFSERSRNRKGLIKFEDSESSFFDQDQESIRDQNHATNFFGEDQREENAPETFLFEQNSSPSKNIFGQIINDETKTQFINDGAYQINDGPAHHGDETKEPQYNNEGLYDINEGLVDQETAPGNFEDNNLDKEKIAFHDDNYNHNQKQVPQKKKRRRRRRKPKGQRLPGLDPEIRPGYPPAYPVYPQSADPYPGYPRPQYPYRPPVRPSVASEALTSITNALSSIAVYDDHRCVPRLLCEAAGGSLGASGLAQTVGSLQPLITLLSAYSGITTSPLFLFGQAVLLGMTSQGNPSPCRYAYPLCPTDPEQLVHYLNNHNGGFFRFFNGEPNLQQFYQSLPGQQNYGLVQQNYDAGQQNYIPGQHNYIPGQHNYNPGQQNYNPGQQNYNPGQHNYNSGQQNYNPVQQNYGLHNQQQVNQNYLGNHNSNQGYGQYQENNRPQYGQVSGNGNHQQNYGLYQGQGQNTIGNNGYSSVYGKDYNYNNYLYYNNNNKIKKRIQNNPSKYGLIESSEEDNNFQNPHKQMYENNFFHTNFFRFPANTELDQNKYRYPKSVHDYNQNNNNNQFLFNNRLRNDYYSHNNGYVNSETYNNNNKNEAVETLYVVRGNGDPNHPEIVRLRPGESIKDL